MISILIPVFNVEIEKLIQELSFQLSHLPIEGEILVFDDCSQPFIKDRNRVLSSIKNVFYKELDKNYGRIEIRKLLATAAKYDWLLFIDCDSTIVNQSYLVKYVEILSDEYDVYTGGTIYQSTPPIECFKQLHWKYGSQRESGKKRNLAFHTNNFLIRKNVFLRLKFPNQLQGYGHEDTWMQIQFEILNKKVHFFDNPVLHMGLEQTTTFLTKTKNALKNLLVLVEIEGPVRVKRKVKLVKIYFFLKQYRMTGVIKHFLKRRIKTIEENLNSCNPSLFQFDLYRLYHLLTIKEKVGKY